MCFRCAGASQQWREICLQGASALNSTLDSTQGLMASTASSASPLLSNISLSAPTAANQTANSSAANSSSVLNGQERSAVTAGQLLNTTALNSSSVQAGLNSTLRLPGQVLNSSLLNGTGLNSTASNSSSLQVRTAPPGHFTLDLCWLAAHHKHAP